MQTHYTLYGGIEPSTLALPGAPFSRLRSVQALSPKCRALSYGFSGITSIFDAFCLALSPRRSYKQRRSNVTVPQHLLHRADINSSIQ